MNSIHISPYSGSWYPESALELEQLLAERFTQSLQRLGSCLYRDALGFVVPHAGPAWSGTVASAVYRSLQQQAPERIVLLAFPHHGGLNNIAIPDVQAIATPFGEVAIDGSYAGGFCSVPEAQMCDHSFEIQLPFLQKAAPQAQITPLYIGRMTNEQRAAAADRLARSWQPGTVFLASSDFTHYGHSFSFVPFPVDAAIGARLQELDFDCIDAAGSLDSGLFLETLRQRNATVCGSAPIALLLDVLQRLGGEDIYQATLDYQTSGEITADYRASVSYAALGYFRRPAFDLTVAEREALIAGARENLQRLRETGIRKVMPIRGEGAALASHRGVFVSLYRGDELLGCLGNYQPREPLSMEVPRLTLAAALDDPRFRQAAAVTGPIEVEISVLTPFRRIRAADQLHVGVHGLFLKLGAHSGLLLPQVAGEREWSADQFLRALCRKATLSPEDWRQPKSRLYVFEAQVFPQRGEAKESAPFSKPDPRARV